MKVLASFIPGLLLGGLLGAWVMAWSSRETVPVERPSPGKAANQVRKRVYAQVESADVEKELSLGVTDWRDDYFTLSLAEFAHQVSGLSLVDFPEAIEKAGEEERMLTLLYRRWAELDARGALRFLITETEYTHTDCNLNGRPDYAFVILEEMLEQDGSAALPVLKNFFDHDMGEGIGYEYGDRRGFEALFQKWAILDFDSVMEFWAHERAGFFYDGSELGIARGAAEVGRSREFLEWVENGDKYGWEEMEQGAREWAERDLGAALRWALDHENTLDGAALDGVIQAWVKVDSGELLEWVGSNGRVSLLEKVTKSHPLVVGEWLRHQSAGGKAFDGLRSELLKPLQSRTMVADGELDFYFEVVQGWRNSSSDSPGEREAVDLERLFLRATRMPDNYHGDERSFRLDFEDRLWPYLKKWGYEDEYEEFRVRRERDALEYSRLKEKRDALYDATIEVRFPNEN